MSNGITAWSYSRYSDYRQCPYKFKLKYIDKLPDPGSPAMQRGNEIHKRAEEFIKAKKEPKLHIDLINVEAELRHCREAGAMAELPWGFLQDWSWNGKSDWFGSNIWFRMKADVAIDYDDSTGLVGDWKTGRKYDENREQIELFGAVALKRFPHWSEVDVRLWYTDVDPSDNEIQYEFDRKDGELILKDWEKKVVAMFKDKRFAPTPNDKCHWCPFSKAKGGPCKF